MSNLPAFSVRTCASLLFPFVLCAGALSAAYRDTYAVVLTDKPAALAAAKRDSPLVAIARDAIRQKQQAVAANAEALGFHVTGTINTVLNAVFVRASGEPAKVIAKLQAIPGVRYVSPMRRAKPELNEAVGLVGATNAWNGVLGGVSSAGTGQKIAILDTGIDQTHPAFQATLTIPSGFPKCDIVANCAYTNNKIIVARSYVSVDAGSDPSTDFPDDITPRDRVGHGTAAAMAAGGKTVTGPLAIITGFAPQAFLGNYKIYGSPGINDEASEQAILQAIDDALSDGMDVASLSSTLSPLEGPIVTDPMEEAIENAITSGMVVVVAAGNAGDTGVAYQSSGYATLGTITSPGLTADAITVGATGNSRLFAQSVQITGPAVPSALSFILAVSGDGVPLQSSFTAPLLDAATVGDGYGCTSYAAGSMTGFIALVERGGLNNLTCSFATQVLNPQAAGAVGVIIYDNLTGESAEPLFPIETTGTSIPAFFVGNSDGASIKSYVDAASPVDATLDPTLNSNVIIAPDKNQVTFFSSHGPVTGSNAMKPDVVAPGDYIYTATQDLDPNGILYQQNRYVLTSGTSFATPIVAGIAALVRQKNPTYTPLQVKSAIVDTGTQDTTDPDFTGIYASPVTSVGGGKAEAFDAVSANITVEPSTISFGLLTEGAVASAAQSLTIVNQSTASLTLTLTIDQYTTNTTATLALDNSSITLAAGASQTVNLTLSGTAPAENLYQGAVEISGGASALLVPYLFLVGTGAPNDMFPVAGNNDVGFVNQSNSQGFGLLKLVDSLGVPVSGSPVVWTALNGGSITNADTSTNSEGLAQATFTLGATANQVYQYNAFVSGFSTLAFRETAIAQPTIGAGGVVNAASFALGQGIAPGSLVAIFGTGLATSTSTATYTPLPISMPVASAGLPTSVGFDATGVSVPAPLLYISAGQVNIQVPWELAGQTTTQMKVNIEPMNGALFTVPIASYSPSCFTSSGIAIAQNLPSYSLVTTANPAVPGQYVVLYCNGLGPVNNTPATGAAAPDATSTTTSLPQVTIGGESATVTYSGLTPGLVGVYQLNVQIPADAASGSLPLVLSIGGVSSATLTIPIQ